MGITLQFGNGKIFDEFNMPEFAQSFFRRISNKASGVKFCIIPDYNSH